MTPITQAELLQAVAAIRIRRLIRASMGEPPPLPPHPEPEVEHGLEDDGEQWDRWYDRGPKKALAEAVRDLTDGELLALAGIDPHTFGLE